ncbi:hypothetical protein PFICI_05387 [Pestalotiopsis fici W106-1]|uniref:Heterokaryon incompatibility domain-containing protein n=1 Tax=Pestalotiopsis fici (strain W106-1 / CGMCC3.15140) TaxID=1229662 RepID=W3XE81_PESFW|nr:uncharacterized protein PFICI_05387 [Pestalotiopsis fici W106-1]ETS83511.1 hypothetical protein PFICI_05387 [Pestalotiopsis fici W106-1]
MQSKREPYRRLDIRASEFRLLILQAGSWDQDLVCNLKISSHPKDEEFEALSYTWGDVGNLVPVTVNEACIGITTNLEIALRHLRKSDQPRTLWIDALCIDQEDTEEKSSQVQRMGEIFSSANSVLAWLGPPEVNSEEAMQTIEKIGNTLWSIVCDGTDDESIGDDGFAYLSRLSPADYEKLGLDISAMNWNAIWAICERPYWHRIWIIQELALAGGTFQNAAQNRCLVGCGTSWIRLPIFSAFVFIFGIMRGNARWMEDNMSPPLYLLTTKGAPPVEQMFQIIWSLDDIFNEDGESRIKRSLSHLQRMSRKFQATDPRDKLYAFLELAESQLVTPDYTLSVSEVYSSWTKLCIQQDQNLHCLHGNRELSNPFGPSWVPELYSQLWDGYAFEFAALDDKIKRSAASVSFGEGGSVLKARGISLGTLDRVVGPFTATCHSSQNEEKTQVKVIPSTFEKFAELVNLYLSLPKDVQEIAWRAFILDTDTSNRNEPKSPAPDSFYHLWRVLISLEPLPDSFFESHLAKETQLNRYLSPFTESLDNALYSARCFFVTNGLRVGLGPRCTKSGDEVVLLYGSPLCFVLRPEGGRYRLIGDAFVQDVAPELWSDGYEGPGLNVQEFEIQ